MVRVKQRYLLVNILYPETSTGDSKTPPLVTLNQPTTDDLTPGILKRAISSEIKSLFGVYGAGSVSRSLLIKYLSNPTSTFIIRVNREQFRLVWAALTFMDKVPVKHGKPCIFRVVHISGTIRKIEQEAIRRAKALVIAAKDEMADQGSGALDALFAASEDAMATMRTAGGDGDDDDDDDDDDESAEEGEMGRG